MSCLNYRDVVEALERMDISITPELARYVRNLVRSRRYKSASEVVREALRLVEEREISELREAVRAGVVSLYRGEFTECDADNIGNLASEVKARGRKLVEERQLSQKRGWPPGTG